jgi:hypothetical protein
VNTSGTGRKPLSATGRIELEIEIRRVAISIADFGLAGVDFFCQQFPDIARKYVQELEKENSPGIGFRQRCDADKSGG